MVALRPEFHGETDHNPGRGGFAVTPGGRRIPIRTEYAALEAAWRLEVAIEDGRLTDAATGRPVATAGGYAGLAGWDTGRCLDRWLYVLDVDGRLYAGDATGLSPDARAWVERRSGLEEIRVWHHSSFVAGRPVLCAGDLATDESGRLVRVTNWSGHYRPDAAALAAALRALRDQGVPLEGVLAEVVGPGGRVRVVDAALLADADHPDLLPDLTHQTRRQDALEQVCDALGAAPTPEVLARLDRWVAAGLRAADPAAFDPAEPAHWSWLVRYAVEGAEPSSP